jgi:hypothetical protein
MARIDRRDSDTPKAYAALLDYAAMGPARSLDTLCERYRSGADPAPPTRRLTSLKDWSRQHDWQQRVQAYDDALALEASDRHTARYIADLEAHRKRASDAGEAIYITATKLLRRMNNELEELEITPATLGVLLRAYTIGLDLEAHALGIDQLLPELEQKEAR